jgi:hypothetical protein
VLRFVVEYACPGFEARDQAIPVGIVAQDEAGAHVRAVGADPVRVAKLCGLPPGAIDRWEEDALRRVGDPVWGPDGKPLDPRDPRWLERFASPGMEAKFFWGPVREFGGTVDELIRSGGP